MANWPKYEPTMDLRWYQENSSAPQVLQQKFIKYSGNFISDISDYREEVWLDVPGVIGGENGG